MGVLRELRELGELGELGVIKRHTLNSSSHSC